MAAPWDVRLTADLPRPANEAFAQVVDELAEALIRREIVFEPGPGGTVRESGRPVGRVERWTPGRDLLLSWEPAPWDPGHPVEVELRFEGRENGCRMELELRGAGGLVGADPVEWTGWVGSAFAAPFLRTIAPSAWGDWLTDRRTRRPSGPAARAVYADPLFHRPNFALLLETLHPGPSDRLLDVGCGGGAFLEEVLASGARAVGVDHSPEMVRVTREKNSSAVRDGRLEVLNAEGSRLPVPDRAFTITMSTGAFGFFPEPGATLREMRRALAPGGRLAVFMGTRDLVGTPACPEPIASRVRFFDDAEIAALARAAGFVDVSVTHPSLYSYAQKAGIPAGDLEMFRGIVGSQLLLGRRPPDGRAPRGDGKTTRGRSPARSRANPAGRARGG